MKLKLDVEITDKLNKAAGVKLLAVLSLLSTPSKLKKSNAIFEKWMRPGRSLRSPRFRVSALNVLVGSRISESKEGYELETINLSFTQGMFAGKLFRQPF